MGLRIVSDDLARSSRDELLKLKDCLEKKSICSLLLDTVANFRCYPFGLVADV